MDRFTRNDLRRLLEIEAWPCVTIYLPLEAGANGKQGPIRLKNLLARAEKLLVQRGFRAQEARQMLTPASDLLEHRTFWSTTAGGLALVLWPEGMETWRLGMSMPELVIVGRRACVKPLVPQVTDNQTFFLLAISQKGARLMSGDRWEIAPLAIDAMPPGLRDALNRAPAAPGIAQGPGKGRSHAVGDSGEADSHKDELLVWFRMIDRALHDYLRDEHAPLVFAGVEYLFPIFSRANTYPQLFEKAVSGNPDHLSRKALHRRATELLAPQWRQALQADRERFERHMGTRLVSASVEEVVIAAHEGRVEALFVDRDHSLWGRFESDSGKVDLVDDAVVGSEDLLDRALYETLAHRGRVYAVPAAEVPGGIALAAYFRYEAPTAAPFEALAASASV